MFGILASTDYFAIGLGRFAFHASSPGEHRICLKGDSTGDPEPSRFTLEILTGAQVQCVVFPTFTYRSMQALDVQAVAKKDHLDNATATAKVLQARVKDMLVEMEYQKEREEAMRNTSEHVNARVMWWSIGEILVLILSAVWQMQHLQEFFRSKKLV